jgi:outer membrane usher protein FimD/PapC
MKVMLNTVDKGEHFLYLTPGGGVLVEEAGLMEIGFREVPANVVKEVEGTRYVDLGSLAGVAFTKDDKASTVRITADPKLFEKHVLELSNRRTIESVRTRDSSAFLNYSLGYNMDNDFRFTSLSLPFEAGISIRGVFGFSSFSYTKSSAGERFVRLMSSISMDDPAALRRHILGDFSASSGALGGGGTFGGLSVSKNFSLAPRFIRSPGLDLSGIVETPSDVEVYVNGMLVKSESLAPGEFEFKNVSNATGSGDAEIVIKDAFEREKRFERPFYLSSVLFKPGLHEYSYNLGFKRKELGTESFEYGDAAFVGFHRLGLTRTLTAGLRGEADKNVINLGGTVQALLWRAGEVDMAVAASRADGQYGYGGVLGYSYSGRGFNLRVAARGFTREYANLSTSADQDKSRFDGSMGLGYNHELIGSISTTFTRTDRYTGTDMERASLFYSRRLLRDVSLFVRANRTDTDDEITDEVFVGLNFFMGRGRSGNLNYRVQDGRVTETVSFNKNPPLGVGSGYRFLAERTEDSLGEREIGGNGTIQYRGPYGIYTADFRRAAEKNSYSLRAAGGVAFINGAIYPSRPITDGFALVKVGGLEGVKVSYSNQEVGTTGSRGTILVPGLISYHDNSVSIDDKDVPVNYEISEIRRNITTPLRGGGVVEFDVKKLQAFVGSFIIVENGEKRPAEYWGLGMELDDGPMEAIVGKAGEFYLENIPAGSYPARLFMKDTECRFDIIMPESDDMLVDMGEVACEMD